MVKFKKITFLGVVHERLLGVGIVLGWDLASPTSKPHGGRFEGSASFWKNRKAGSRVAADFAKAVRNAEIGICEWAREQSQS